MKKINNIELKDKLAPNYVFDKKLFRRTILVLFVYTLLLIGVSGFDFENQFFYTCEYSVCNNPYFNNSLDCPGTPEFCATPSFLSGYTIGKEQPNILKTYPYVVLGVLGVIFIFNHYKNNVRKTK